MRVFLIVLFIATGDLAADRYYHSLLDSVELKYRCLGESIGVTLYLDQKRQLRMLSLKKNDGKPLFVAKDEVADLKEVELSWRLFAQKKDGILHLRLMGAPKKLLGKSAKTTVESFSFYFEGDVYVRREKIMRTESGESPKYFEKHPGQPEKEKE